MVKIEHKITTQTFIFVHDQNIVLDFKKHNKFLILENVKYVFLGDKVCDLIKDFDDVIICRELPNNIEEYPKLTSFSGWYAIWKNNLYDSDYINLFEYDINLMDNFYENYNKSLLNKSNVIGYIPFNPQDYNFIGHSIWSSELINSINKNYNIDTHKVIKKLPKNYICSMTSNHTMNKKTFDEYMKWINPMVDDIKISKYSGHQMERSISLFYILNNINNIDVIPNILHHFQFDSHETQGISKSNFINNYNKLL